MRHFFLPGAIRPGARRMVEPARPRALVAAASSALLGAPGLFGTSLIAVDVAAVATRADQHQDAAACAQIEAPRGMSLFPLCTASWTRGATRGILPRHTCSGTVWGAAAIRLARLGSAPCLLSRRRNLEPQHCPAHGARRAGSAPAASPPSLRMILPASHLRADKPSRVVPRRGSQPLAPSTSDETRGSSR